MRGGIDVRRKCKPSVFVELVDTRWDEYNCVAEMNTYGGMYESQTVVAPTGAGGPPPGTVPVPSDPSSGPSGRPNEPNPLPGGPADEPPTPGAQPTARRNMTDDDDEDEDEDLAQTEAGKTGTVKVSAYSRLSARRAAKAASQTDDDSSTGSSKKSAVRPGASRLFSRQR